MDVSDGGDPGWRWNRAWRVDVVRCESDSRVLAIVLSHGNFAAPATIFHYQRVWETNAACVGNSTCTEVMRAKTSVQQRLDRKGCTEIALNLLLEEYVAIGRTRLMRKQFFVWVEVVLSVSTLQVPRNDHGCGNADWAVDRDHRVPLRGMLWVPVESDGVRQVGFMHSFSMYVLSYVAVGSLEPIRRETDYANGCRTR